MSKNLTPKQQRFCEEYMIDLNATRSAKAAGYSEKNADKIGSELLGKTRVAARLAELREEQSKRTEITADYVLQALFELAEASRKIDPETGKAVDGGVATKCLELLGKHRALFTDRVQRENVGTISICWQGESQSSTEVEDVEQMAICG